jgi:hypothetical protein
MVAPRSETQATGEGTSVRDQLELLAAKWRLDLLEIGRPPANRRETILVKKAGVETSQSREFDPGERVGVPSSVEALREMVTTGRVRREREMPKRGANRVSVPQRERRERELPVAAGA